MPAPTSLSPRETELYGYLLQDMRMKEISHLMSLNKNTVDTYATNIYRKKGVKSRIGLLIQFYTETKDKT